MWRNISGILGSLTTALSNVFEMAGNTKHDAGPNYPQFFAELALNNMWKSNQALKRLKADQFGRAVHFNLNNFSSHLNRFCVFVYFCILHFSIFFKESFREQKTDEATNAVIRQAEKLSFATGSRVNFYSSTLSFDEDER